jgi:hypothetical protein
LIGRSYFWLLGSQTSSNLSEHEKDSKNSIESESEESEHENDIHNKQEYSSEVDSESSEISEELKDKVEVNIHPVPKLLESERRMDMFFQSTEQDEISGGLLPSFRNNATSSIFHEITEVNDHEKVSKLHSSRREDPVGVARQSTVVDTKVWKIEDDELLRVITEQNAVSGKIFNWSKITKEINKHRSKSFFLLTPKECEHRYHNISKASVDKLWTDKEIQKLIELHQKYKNNWKIIAKKMPGKYSICFKLKNYRLN